MLSLLVRIWHMLTGLTSRFALILSGIADLKAGQARTEAVLKELSAQVQHLLDLMEPGPAVKLIFTTDLDGQISFGVTMQELKDTQQVLLSITPVDKRENPAPIDGVPVWSTSNSEVITLDVAADGLTATAKAVGPLGSAVVSVKADADLGDGVAEISGVLEIQVFASGATSVSITAGAPEEQPST